MNSINFIGDIGRSACFNEEEDAAKDVDDENANTNNHEIEEDAIKENEHGREHYAWNIYWLLIFC